MARDSSWDTQPLPEPPVTPLRFSGTWQAGHLALLDQTRLPREETWLEHRTSESVIDDIKRLAVRGAPIIGVAGAYALVLAARELILRRPGISVPEWTAALEPAAQAIADARPTAVNLPRAVATGLKVVADTPGNPEQKTAALLEAAERLEAYERDATERIARHGAAWLDGRTRFLTHCNAGALVTPGLGTALAPFYALHAAGRDVHVYCDETRPLLQGLRLTAYELGKAGVSHAVITDGAAAGLLRRGEIDAAVVGSDRICANGDVANKVGTYSVALACEAAGVPFVVAAPLTTIDRDAASGDDVPIEERPRDQTAYLTPHTAPRELTARAPAFDITPARLVTAIVTEVGVTVGPDEARIAALFD